jgi:hypothetical protein
MVIFGEGAQGPPPVVRFLLFEEMEKGIYSGMTKLDQGRNCAFRSLIIS